MSSSSSRSIFLAASVRTSWINRSNPPYGERLSDDAGVTKLYAEMGQVFAPLKTWSKFILTSDEAFESKYGSLADKKRKLYNGTLKVDLYQYFGQRVKRQEVK